MTYAPWLENSVTVASTVVPSPWLVTKPRKSSGELIASAALPLRELSDFLVPRDRFSPAFDPLVVLAAPLASAAFDPLADSLASAAFVDLADFVDPDDLAALGVFADSCESGALVFSPAETDFFVALVARRLTGPRTGTRATKTQPTPGTGLPPQRRPSANSHSWVAWNSWNESFERTVAPETPAI